MGGIALRLKVVILQEIVIIFISFKDTDLLYFLLSDVSPDGAGYGAPWWPWDGGSRLIVAYLSHFSSFSLVLV